MTSSFRKLLAAGVLALGAAAGAVRAADATVKVGVLHSLSGTMAISEVSLRDKADGVHLTCEPAKVLPMAQRYFLF